jgi:hypothetical protein
MRAKKLAYVKIYPESAIVAISAFDDRMRESKFHLWVVITYKYRSYYLVSANEVADGVLILHRRDHKGQRDR